MNRILCGLFSALLLCALSVVDAQAQRDAHLAGHTIDKTTGEERDILLLLYADGGMLTR